MALMFERSAGRAIVWSLVGFIALNVVYQMAATWSQFGVLMRAHPLLVTAAVANQILAYVVIIPAMRRFYAHNRLRVSVRRTFAIISAGLAVSRVMPGGEYLVWRLNLRNIRGGAAVTTQWYVLYLTAVLGAMTGMFVLAAALATLLYPNLQAGSVLGAFRYVPLFMAGGLGCLVVLLRVPLVRTWLMRVAFEKLSPRSLSPLGIVRENHLGRADISWLVVAAVGTWLFEAVTLYLCLAAFGLNVPLVLTLFGFGFARLISNIPLVPGGVGQMEASAAVFFAAYGFATPEVLAATFVYRLITYWPPLTIGAVAYVIAGFHRIEFDLPRANRRVFALALHHRGIKNRPVGDSNKKR